MISKIEKCLMYLNSKFIYLFLIVVTSIINYCFVCVCVYYTQIYYLVHNEMKLIFN